MKLKSEEIAGFAFKPLLSKFDESNFFIYFLFFFLIFLIYIDEFDRQTLFSSGDPDPVLRCIVSGFFANAAKFHSTGAYR